MLLSSVKRDILFPVSPGNMIFKNMTEIYCDLLKEKYWAW